MDGPLEVVAGPGTGKTRVITERVVHLTTQLGHQPDAILALTFTDKAAEEMASRIRAALTKIGQKGSPKVSTFHAFCLLLVQEYPHRLGYDQEPKLLVGPLFVQFVAENVDKFVTDNTDLVGKTSAFAASLAKFVSLCHDERLLERDLVAEVDAWLATIKNAKDRKAALKVRDLAASVPILLEIQRQKNIVTYGDLLSQAVRLLEENEDVREEVAARYDHVLVDEYQDNNRAQSDLVRLLAQGHRNVCVVGDEDQSIYRFRGARAGIMNSFLTEWTQGDSKPEVVTLEENYRSTDAIIQLGQTLIAYNAGRPTHKTLRKADASTAAGPDKVRLARAETEMTERAYVLQEIRRLNAAGHPLGEIAILVRSLAHAGQLVAELRNAGVGVEVVGGGGLFSNSTVREVLAWLKALDNPEGEEVALNRLVRMQGFGLTHDDQRAIHRRARDERTPLMALLERLQDAAYDFSGLSPQGHARIRGFLRLREKFLEEARPEGRPDVTGLILEILDLTGLGRRLRPDNAEGRQGLAAIGGLLQAAENYQQHFPYPSLHGFVRHLDLLEDLGHDDTVGEASNDAGTVKVMTVHQSKGREFPVVFVHQLHRFPPQNKREWDRKFLDHLTLDGADVEQLHEEEERRVLYVSLTRAICELHLTTSQRRADGKEVEASAYEEDILDCASLDVKAVAAADIEPPGEVAQAFRTRRAQEARLTYLVSRLGSHAEGHDVETTLRESLSLVSGLLADGAEGGVEAVERALKTIGIPLPPEVRYLEPDKPKGVIGPLWLSASSLSLYDDCPRQFYYKQVVRIPETASFEARLGTAIHAALEKFHRKHPQPHPNQFADLDALFTDELRDVQFSSEKEKDQGVARGRSILQLYLSEEHARGVTVEAVEKEFNVNLADDVTLTGKIDRIDRLPDGRLRVVDYKTGTLKSRNEYLDGFQMPLYAWATLEHMGEKLEAVEVIGLKDVKELKGGPVLDKQVLPWEDGSKYAITAERLAAVKKRITEIIGGIREGKFDAVPDERRCGWCRYNLICESASGVTGEALAPARAREEHL